MKYEIVRSGRRSVAITVKDGRVIVKAPYRSKKDHLDSLVKKHEGWIKKALERDAEKAALTESLTEADINELKKAAKIYFGERLEYYAAVMGLEYKSFRITSAKTRFGSCSSSKSICFSYRLMLYPKEARDYVVVHELCHLVHMDHSPAFYRLVSEYMPDYKERRKLLKLSHK